MALSQRVLVVLLLAILSTSSYAGGESWVDRTYAVRAKIDIEGDANFTAANGVVGGNGTETNPYRIENWTILLDLDPDSWKFGIRLVNTTAHVILRGNTVSRMDGGFNDVGVLLDGVSNVTVLANVICCGWLTIGIQVVRSQDVRIEANSFTFSGIYVRDSNSVVIVNNGWEVRGISVVNSTGLAVRDNRVVAWYNPGFGLLLQWVQDVQVSGNEVVVGEHAPALILYGGQNATIRKNRIHNIDPGSYNYMVYGLAVAGYQHVVLEDNIVDGMYQSPSVSVEGSKDVQFLRNNVSNGRAVVIERSQDIVAAGNTLTGVGGLKTWFQSCYWSVGSLALTGSTNATLTGNQVLNGGGIDVWGSNKVAVLENRVVNSRHGVLVAASSDVRIADEVIERSADGITTIPDGGGGFGCPYGVGGAPSSRILIENSTIRESTNWGIRLSGEDHTVRNVTLTGNQVGGIAIIPYRDMWNFPYLSTDIRLESNNITGNPGLGVLLDTAERVTLEKNRFYRDGVFLTHSVDRLPVGRFYTSHLIGPDNTVEDRPILYVHDCTEPLPQVSSDGQPPDPSYSLADAAPGQLIVTYCNGVTLRNLTVRDTDAAIQAAFVTNLQVSQSVLEDNLYGMHLSKVTTARVEDNEFSRNGAGIAAVDSNPLEIEGNQVVDSRTDGLFLKSSPALVRGNVIADNGGDGLHVEGGRGLIVDGNHFEKNLQAGVSLSGVTDAQVFGNAFLDHVMPARDDAGAANAWNLPYPEGGNYWSNQPGPDGFQGPFQDIPGADGIVDYPFVIDADSKDQYPLAGIPDPDAIPLPPANLRITLSGNDSVLDWQPPSDLASNLNYVGFGIDRGESYEPEASGYARVGFVSRQTMRFVDPNAGRGSSTSFFYRVCALTSTRETCARQVVKWSVDLAEGPSLLGIPVALADPRLAAVFENLSVEQVRSYAAGEQDPWRRWSPGRSSFSSVSPDGGLWVTALANATMTVAGALPDWHDLPLRAGWNLLAFSEFQPRSVASWLAGNSFTAVEVFDPSAAPYFLRRVGGAHVLRPGDALWIHAEAAGLVLTGN